MYIFKNSWLVFRKFGKLHDVYSNFDPRQFAWVKKRQPIREGNLIAHINLDHKGVKGVMFLFFSQKK